MEELLKGKIHNLLPGVLSRIQEKLYLGKSNNAIAKEVGLWEGSIRYALKMGY